MSGEHETLVRRFVESFVPLVASNGAQHGGVQLCNGAPEAAAWIASALRAQGVRRVLAAARPEVEAVVRQLHAPGPAAEVLRPSAAPLDPSVPGFAELLAVDPVAPVAAGIVAGFDAGIGGADLLIAETGSLVLVPSRQEPRELSLLPRVHFVVARVDRIVPRLADALENVPVGADFVIVTGPSRTADVEKTLVVPAHGPGWLYVALLR